MAASLQAKAVTSFDLADCYTRSSIRSPPKMLRILKGVGLFYRHNQKAVHMKIDIPVLFNMRMNLH
jgi:hypothetical protein